MKLKYFKFGGVKNEFIHTPIYYIKDELDNIVIDSEAIQEEFNSLLTEVCLNPHIYIKEAKK